MTTSTNTPRLTYLTSDGSTVNFTFNFDIADQNSIAVYVGTTLKTLTTDYTVSFNSGTSGTGTVTLNSAPAINTKVFLIRDTLNVRSTDFAQGGAFLAATINNELDRITQGIQDVDNILTDKVLRVGEPTVETATLTLPAAASRASKILGFDASGNVSIVNVGTGTVDSVGLSTTDSNITLGGTNPIVNQGTITVNLTNPLVKNLTGDVTGNVTATTGTSTFNNVIVNGDLTVEGTTTTVNTATLDIEDNIIRLATNQSGAPSVNAGIEVERGTSADKSLVWNETTDKWTIGSDTFVAGTVEANVTGNVTGNLTGNADSATYSSAVTLTSDNTTNATNYLLFSNAASGNQSPRTDTGLTYNPGTNTLTGGTFSGVFSGTLTGANDFITVVGDDSTGVNVTLGETFKIAGGSNITTAVSGDTLTINGSNPAQGITVVGDDSTGTRISDGETVKIAGGSNITTSMSGDTLTISGSNPAQGITFVGDDSTGTRISDGETVKIAGTQNITTAVSGDTLTITGPDLTSFITASSTDTLTNKTFNANGTGNSITNIEVADFASGVVDTDLASVSASDDTLPSAKAVKAYIDAQNTAQAITFVGDDSTGTAVNSGETIKFAGSTNITTAVSGDTLTITGPNLTSFITASSTDTLTNKSISLTTNTLTGTSAELATAISDETGSGSLVFGTSPTLTTPVISSIVNTGTLTLPTSTDTLVGRATTDTLTNKTLTSPVISSITNTGTLTLPTSTDTLVGRATTDTLTNKSISLTTNTITGTLTEFNTALSDDNFVSLTGTETLTNKTLTTPVIASITNTGTLTLPTSTDTLVGRATTDTLTNKTFDANGTGNSITNIEVADLAAGVLDTDLATVSASDDTIPSAKAVKAYIDAQNTAQSLTFVGDDSTGTAVNSGETFKIAGTSNITTAVSGDTLTITGSKNIDVNEISSSDSSAIQINDAVNVLGTLNAKTIVTNDLISEDSSSINVLDGLNVSGTLSADVLDVNEISSGDSSAIQIIDAVNVDGILTASQVHTQTIIGRAVDGNISITPNGTGDINLSADTVKFGDTNSGAIITTAGTGALYVIADDSGGSQILLHSGADADITLTPKGTGNVNLSTDTVKIGDSNAAATLTTNGTGNITIDTNSGTNSGSIAIANGVNGNITLTPNGTGSVVIDGISHPQADGTNGQMLITNGSGQLSFSTPTTGTITSITAGTGLSGGTITSTGTIAIDSTVATLTGTQTLTNKTLTTPIISSISNTGTLTLPTATDTLVGRATTDTFTNKSGNISQWTNDSGYITGSTITIVGDDSTGTTLNNGETLKIAGTGGITTAVSGDILTINSTADIVTDLSPQLGANLDVNGFSITSTSNADINIGPDGTGNVNLNADTIRVGDSSGTAVITTDTPVSDLTLCTQQDTNGTHIKFLKTSSFPRIDDIQIYPQQGKIILKAGSTWVGDGGGDAQLSSNGTNSLTICTNNNVNSGTISIAQGANNNITITPHGTGSVIAAALKINGTTLSSDDSTKITLAENVDITGALQVNDINSADSTAIQINDDLNVSGATTINNTLAVTSTSTFTGDATFIGSIISANNNPVVIAPDGTGDVHLNADSVRIGDNNTDATLATRGTGDLILTTNEGAVTEGIIRIYDGANGNITLTPDGTGSIVLDGLNWPQADGSANYVLKTNGAGQLSWVAQTADTNTTYGISAETATGGTNLRLTGSDATTDNVKLAEGTGITITRTDADTITFAASGSGAVDIVNDTTPQLGGSLDVNGQIITSTSNGNIELQPNGTGDVYLTADTVRVGDSNANATITTNGTGDLILNTNAGSSSGSITIADAANGNITIAVDGTGKVIMGDDFTAANLDSYTNNSNSFPGFSDIATIKSNLLFTSNLAVPNITTFADRHFNNTIYSYGKADSSGTTYNDTDFRWGNSALALFDMAGATADSTVTGSRSAAIRGMAVSTGFKNSGGGTKTTPNQAGLTTFNEIQEGHGGDLTVVNQMGARVGNSVRANTGEFSRITNSIGFISDTISTGGTGSNNTNRFVTNEYGFYDAPTTTSSLVTNHYGFYVHTGAAATNKYAFYSADDAYLSRVGTLERYNEKINSLTSSSTITVDADLAPVHKVTLGINTQFGIANLSTGQTVTLIIVQDGTGSRTASFTSDTSTAVKFAGGTPTLSTAANSIDIVTIFNDGTNMYGNIAKAYA